MKKFIYSLCCLLMLGISLNSPIIAAGSIPLPVSYLGQGRIGFGLAVEYLNAEAKVKDNYSPFSYNYQSDRSQTRKQVNIAPSIELGTMILDDYYIGLISSWRYVGAKTISRAPLKNMTHFYHEFKINYYFDILAKPGYRITPTTMFYGLVGPSIVKWSHTTDQVSRVYINNQETKEDRFKISKNSVGFGLGFGLEHLFKEKFLFSIDYVHHFHKSASKHQTMTFLDVRDNAVEPRPGNVSKSVMPSYSAIVLRFSTALRVW